MKKLIIYSVLLCSCTYVQAQNTSGLKISLIVLEPTARETKDHQIESPPADNNKNQHVIKDK